MKRRELLTGLVAGGVFSAANGLLWKMSEETFSSKAGEESELPLELNTLSSGEPANDPEGQHIDKVRNFENEFADDIYLTESEAPLMNTVLVRLKDLERIVGHGNYNLLSFDQLLRFSKRYSSIGEFTRQELDFIEKIFFTDAKTYGFMGEKVSTELTTSIAKKDTYKVPYSGHYLFKGDSRRYYEKLKKDVGDSVILTSGIRSNVKQMNLFMAKTVASNGNLSKASRSLAPPGHSFHGVGDFDVGKMGWGRENFTNKFSQTDEFKRMQDLGYVQIRYTENNKLGVRFEPWHIKVV